MKFFRYCFSVFLIFSCCLAVAQVEEVKFPKLPEGVVVEEGRFTLPSQLFGNPEISVFYRIPMKDGKPIPSAHNIVFYAPHPNEPEAKALNKNKTRVCDSLGYTFFSMEIKTEAEDLQEDRKKSYYYHDSGAWRTVFEAQDRIAQKHGLELRKLLVMGFSGGANMAYYLGLYHPDRVGAVALFGGSHYDPPTAASPIPWLILHTRGDKRTPMNEQCVNALKERGANVVYCQNPPNIFGRQGRGYTHLESPVVWDLMVSFLWGVVQTRDQAGIEKVEKTAEPSLWSKLLFWKKEPQKVEPEQPLLSRPEAWPLMATANDPRTVRPVTQESLAASLGSERAFLSKEFAYFWGQLPLPLEEKVADPPVSRSLIWSVSPGPTFPPKGIVVVGEGVDAFNKWRVREDLYFLAEKGFVAVCFLTAPPESIRLKPDPAQVAEGAGVLMKWVNEHPEWAALPVFCLGYNEYGVAMLEAIWKNGGRKPDSVVLAGMGHWFHQQEGFWETLNQQGGEKAVSPLKMKFLYAAWEYVSPRSLERVGTFIKQWNKSRKNEQKMTLNKLSLEGDNKRGEEQFVVRAVALWKKENEKGN